jgi:hypothetical protein
MNKLIAVGSLMLGFGGGAWWNHHSGPTDCAASMAHVETPAATLREPGLSAGRVDTDPSVLRALIREEVAAAVTAKVGSGPASPTRVQNAVSPEKQAQRREALEQIDALMAGGVWGNGQRLSFQQKLATLDPEQREHALLQAVSALNSGSLKITTDGPPLL